MFITDRGQLVNDGAYVHNMQGYGEAGQMLGRVRWEPGLMRPYFDRNGRPCVTVNTGQWKTVKDKEGRPKRVPDYREVYIQDLQKNHVNSAVLNATTLTKEAWIQFDRAIVRARRQRLRAWQDLLDRSQRGGFNAMAKMTLEYQAMTDPGEAVVDMDARTDARRDRPQVILRSLPLPITHGDFSFSQREIAVSQGSGMPLDTTMMEAIARRVMEVIEQTLIGTITGVTYGTQTAGPGTHTGTSTVYGYTNYPYRVTKTDLHTPTSANPENVVEDVLEMRETMRSNGYFGPYVVYHSTGYDRYLDDDYFRTGGTAVTRTLRERLTSIEGIADFKRLDYLTSGYQLVMVNLDSETVEAINGMDATVVQWEDKGGLERNFKIMAIQVPLLKAPYNGVAGVIHGTTS